MIERETIKTLARLSRMEISEKEVDVFRKEIEAILEYVSQVQEATKTGGKELLEKDFFLIENVIREDIEPHESGLFSKEILQQAPDREGDFIRVPKIL